MQIKVTFLWLLFIVTVSAQQFEEAFNTPECITNIGIGNPALWRNLGFSVNYKCQGSLLWKSSVALGAVPAIPTIEAQIGCGVKKPNLSFKLGGTNVFKCYYTAFAVGPSVGEFYYLPALLSVQE